MTKLLSRIREGVTTTSINLLRKEIIKNKNGNLQKVSIQEDNYDAVFERCSNPYKRAMVVAREKGAFSWLNTPPLRKYAYVLNKAE